MSGSLDPNRLPPMIFEAVPEAYDIEGNKVTRPSKQLHACFNPDFEMGRYAKQRLSVRCPDIDAMATFLKTCRYVPDVEQFGKRDYWMLPRKFEERRKGDCEDFALWTWRQLMDMGYPARFTGGRCGVFMPLGHAWVTFEADGKTYIIEPTRARMRWYPKLFRLGYHPTVSVAWDGKRLSYYDHAPREYSPGFLRMVVFLAELLAYVLVFLPRILLRLGRRKLRKLSAWWRRRRNRLEGG